VLIFNTGLFKLFNPQIPYQSFEVDSGSAGFFLTVLRRFGLGFSSAGFSTILSTFGTESAVISAGFAFLAGVFLTGAFFVARRTGAFLAGFSTADFTSVDAGTSAANSVASGFGLARLVLRCFGFSAASSAG
jgi:hypothetical protein